MAKQYKVIVNTGKADNNKVLDIQQGVGDRGQSVRIKAQAGAKYELQEVGRKKPVGPDYIKAKRVGKDLHILFEDERQASLIIEDYYEVMPEGYNAVIGQAENGSFYEYIPEDPKVSGLVPMLGDGAQAVSVALGGAEVSGAGAALGIVGFSPLLGLLGLGAAGGAAYLANRDKSTAAPANNVKTALVIDPISGDNLITVAEGGAVNYTVTGKVTGAYKEGDEVSLKLGDKTYKAKVKADGTFSTEVPMADLKADADTKIEGSVTGTGGDTATAAQDYQVETEATAGKTTALMLDPITPDNLISAAEKTGNINVTGKVTGKYAANDLVTITVNDKTYTGIVNAQGSFSIPVPATELLADRDTLVEARITGTGGSTANAMQDYGVGEPAATGATPTVIVSSNKTNLATTGETATLTFTLSEASSDFVKEDITAIGGALSNFQKSTTNPLVYTATFTPTAGVTSAAVYVASERFTNAQGQSNLDGADTNNAVSMSVGASGDRSGELDVTPPNIAVTSSKAQLQVGETATLTFTLSEASSDFVKEDITLNGGTLSNFQGSGTSYTATFTPNAGATSAAVFVSSNQFTDAAGNLNKDGVEVNNSWSFAVGNTTTNTVTGKLASISDNAIGIPNDNITNDRTPEINGTVPAGSSASITINGQTYPVVVNSDGSWSFTQPTNLPDGTYTPVITVTSPSGSPNIFNGTPFTIDATPPTVAITGSTAALSAGQSTVLTFTLSEASADLNNADIQSLGGTLSTLVQSASNPLVYTATFTAGAGSTNASVQVGSNKFSDAAGNFNADGAEANNNWSISTNNSPLPTPSLKTALSIDPIATDNVLLASEQGASSYTVTGKVTGKYAAGDVVELVLNGKTYAATVAADGNFSAAVAMADLKADADTKIEASITATGGDKATAAQDYTLEAGSTATQTALSINPVTADNIISADEVFAGFNATITGTVTGKFVVGDVVTLTVNNKTFTGVAGTDGKYSIAVPVSDLKADADTQIDGVVTGSGGTLARAIQDYGVDNSSTPTPAPSAKTALHLEPITANLDNILSQSEGASTTITVGGFASGTFAEGDMVSLVLNGRTYTALVDNNGNYSVSVLSADLKADADKTIEASITGTGGSAATAAQTYQVETASNTGKITALSIDPVTSDNMLGSSETTGNIPVNGYVSGAFSVNDTVTLTINGKTFTGKPDSSGFFSINVPATDLAADADTKVEGTVTGTGGTTAKAVQDYGVDSSNNRNLDPTPSGDTTPPTIEVERLGSGTLTRSETIRFTLSEASTNFNDADITVTGGTLSQFTPVPTSGTPGTGYTQYTATFTPAANASGTATIGVAAGKFTDNAGNQNLDTFSGAAGTVTGQVVETNNLVSIAYNTQASPNPPADTTAPSIIVARAGSASLASGNTELITFTLSENSSTFTLADIDVSGGTLSGFAPVPGSGTAAGGYHQYTAVFTPAANSVGTATIGVAAGQFTDAASNANTDTYVSGAAGYQANNLVSIGYNTQQSDTTKPSIEVSRAGSGTVTANETIYFTLSEASTTFTQGDIDVTGGTLSNFAPVSTSGSAAGGYTQYTATFTPSANASGSATIGVDAAMFTDAAGNANADTYSSIAPDGVTQEDNNQVVLQYNTRTNPLLPDTTAPTIAITADKATLTAGQTAQLSFVLSEPSTDFAQSDVQVSGGTLGNWVQVSPTQYSATFTPTAGLQGTGSVYVATNAFRDAANNPNADGADTNNTVNFITNHGNSNADTTAPTIAIARMGSGTLTSSETISFTLSEASTTFGLGDITVTGGTLSQFTPVPTSGTAGSGYTHYTATFTPTSGSTGTATIGVAAGKFSDNAGNQNLDTFSGASGAVAGQVVEANNLVSIAYNTQANPNPPADTTAPTIVVERATTSSLATGNTELITFTLSENSSNFTLADIDVSGGSLSGLAPVPSSGTAASGYHQYTAVFTPAANSVGTATIGVTASKFSDAAGNVNQDDYRLAGPENLNNQVVIAYNTRLADTTEPTIEVTRAGSGTVGSTGETIYFTLSEASTTFVQSDIDVTGGTLSNFAPLPSSGTASGGYTQYTATFTPNAGSTGTATIGVVSGKFTDAAGNNNQDTYRSPAPAGATSEANNQVSLNYNTSTNPTPPADTTAPTIAISADKATLAAGQSATVSFVLSEPSSDFIQTDVQVTGGTLSNWTQINATTYTATYTAAAGAQGTGRISVASNAFRDAANNFNADGADANNTVDFITNYGNNGGDTTPPTIVVARTSSGTLTSSETLTFTLSEAATNFVASDIDVTGGTLSNFSPVPTSGTPGTGYTQYTATFTPTANASGSATIGVAAGQFTDNAGNANQDDYRLAGAENTNNLVTIAYNTQANPNPPADSTAPSIVVARAGTGSLTSGGTDTITFTLSENASTFTLDDIDVVGGVLSNFAPVTSSGSASTGYHQYTATFTPTANASGSATIGVAAGKFSDAAGNANQDTYVSGAAGYQTNNLVTIGYNTTQPDTTAPTIEVTRAGSGTVGSTGETIYFTLSEASTTFTLADIDVTGGAVSNLVPVASSASGTGYKQYTATFTPSAGSAGTATIGVASGKFTDLSGNANTDTYVSPAPAGAALEANNLISLSYNTQTNPATPDTTAPSVAVTIDKTALSAGQSAVVTFTLSEASTTFAQSDVDVTGGALSGWTQVSASVYSATFTPTANTAGTATIGVKSGTFSDAAGNLNADTYLSPAPAGANTESNNQVSLSYNAIPADTTAPSIIVSRTNAGTTLAAGANETITFKLSEASLDFDISDVAVTGGTLSSFTPVPTSGTPGTGYTEYTASFTPSANSAGTATIGVASGKFSDNAGNPNTDTYVSGAGFEADNQVSLAYNTVPPDTTAPKIALSRKGSGNLVGGGSDEITFVLSESSTSFTLADIDVVGGTLTNFAPVLSSGDATRGYTDYTATFTPTANSSGLARIGVQSGKFNDTAGNANLDTYLTGVSGTTVEANNVIDITYNTTTPDTTAPSVVVSRSGAGMVSTSETIYFTLSEASTTFTQSDIDVQGGTLSGFAPVTTSGDATNGYTQYTATFTPIANSSGVATVGVKSGTFSDMAGNANADTYMSPAPTGATFETNNQVSLNFNTLVPDTTAPTIAIDRSGTGVVTGNETITFTLSEASTNFIASDIDVAGGTLSGFSPVLSSGNASTGYTQYTATFTPTAGTVGSAWVAVASSKFTDAASNTNLDTYLANVSGTNREANNTVEFSVNTDTTAPLVAIARANGQTTQTFTGAETITFSLSEDSSDFSAADVVVTGGTLSNFSGSGRTYSATFTPTANASGTVTIGVAAGTFRDAAGNQNLDTYSGSTDTVSGRVVEANNFITAPFNTDTTAPTVIVTRTGGASGTVTGAESITFTFSEAINPSSFVSTDIDAVGGSISNLLPDLSSGTAATGYTRYSATFTPTAGTSGTGSVGILATKFTDVAGNPNADSYALTGAENANNQVSFAINTSAPDTTPPTIAITRAGAGTVTGAETIYFTLSEASTDFAQADIDVSGGSLTNFQQSSTNPLVYSATFTPAANSTATATIGVAAGKFKDAANNTNLDTYSGAPTAVSGQVVEGNNQLSLSVNTDTTAPTIVVERQGSSTIPVTGPITVSFTLSESSTNFTLDDIDAVGGTVSNLQGSGTSYTATFTPTANAVGTASVGVASNKFNDAAGNANLDTYLTGVAGTTTEGANTTGANIVVFQYATDTTRPTVAISSNKSTLALGDTAVLTLQFNEPVTDITTSDFTLSGGTITNLVAVAGTNNTVYTATYTPAPNSTANSVISIASDKFSDAAGNFNNDGADANNTVTMTTNTVAPDTTAPTILVESSVTSLLAGQTSLITFTLSEASINFAETDVVVTGGTIGQFQQSGTNPLVYTAVFTPTPNSTTPASVLVPSLSFTDAAGNNNVDGADTGPSNTNIVNLTVNTVVPDTTRPTVAISSNKSTLALGDTAVLTLVFSEPVTDIEVADFTLSGGSIAGLSAVPGTNNTVYQATYTPAPNSTANSVISIASDKFSDAAGNFNADGADTNNTVTMTTNTMPAISLVNDTAAVGEAGGVANGTAGAALASTVSGVSALNVLANDTSATSVTGVSAGTTNGTMGQNLVGQYGTLVMNANGSYTYAVDNTNATVQALRGSSNTLTDVFTYTASDGSTSRSANLTITITGTNDAPVAVADTATAVEAGGSANGTAGTNPSGNVLTNDTDVDSGDTKTVSAIAGGTLGSAKAGSYGSLTLNADGSYSYVVDNANASVQALRTSANTLTDTFSYTVQDAAGATSTATLTVTVQGANDAPTVATTVSNKTGTVGTALSSFTGPTFADVDTVTNETATVTATLANGQPLSSIGLSYNASTNTFSGTPTAAGTYTLLVTDTDAGGLTAQTTFDIVIASPILPTTTITQINGDVAPLAAPTLTITDTTTANAPITGFAANSQVVRYKFDFSTSVSNFALTDISFVDSATGVAVPAGNIGTLQGSGASYYVDVTMPTTGSGSVAAIVNDGSYNDSSNAQLLGSGNSWAQAYSGSGGDFGSSTVASVGSVFQPTAITLSNGNSVSYYYKSGGTAASFVLFNSSGQIIKTLTDLPVGSFPYTVANGGDTISSAFATPNGGFGFIYSWVSTSNGTHQKRLVTYDAAGNMVSGPIQLASVPTDLTTNILFPSTVTADGNLAFAYKGSDTYTHVRKVSLAAGTFGNQLSDTIVSGNVDSAPSELVQLTNGNLGVVWFNQSNTVAADTSSFKYRFINSDGSLNNNFGIQSIAADSMPNTFNGTVSFINGQGGVKAIPLSNGGMAVTYMVSGNPDNGGSRINRIALVLINSSGVVSSPVLLDTPVPDSYNGEPDVAQLPNGQLMVMWSGPSSSVYRIVNADGTLSGSPTTLSTLPSPTSERPASTALTVMGSGKVLAIQNGNYVILSPADGTQTISGSTASDTQIGGDGADTLTGGGGADVILAGAGNDTVVINASNISNLTTAGRLLDGGTGIDTLRIGADASTLDLSKSAVQANVQNFEDIDLGADAVVNTVILNASAVQRLATQNLDGTSSNKQLIIDGTSSDLVKLSGQWNNGIQAGYWQQSSTTPTRTVGGVTYKVYTISGLSGVEVLVNNAITSANTDLAYQMASGDIVTVPSNSAIVGDLETTATGGSTGSGDGGSQQPLATSSTTSDTSPLVQGTLSQALSGTQVLKLFRTNVTDGGSAVEVSANVTTSGTNWQFQDSGLVAGKQYRYEARIMDGSTLVDASNTYTINQASATAPDTTPPTVAVSRSGSGTMTGAETITFTLGEASTDFAVSDVVFSGGTLTNFAGSGTTYTATFTPTANSTGTFQVGVQANAFKDAAGNFNTDDYRNAGAEDTNNQVTAAFSTVPSAPVISLVQADGAPVAGPTLTISDNIPLNAAANSTVTFNFDFSQAVSGFQLSDISFINASTGAAITSGIGALSGSGASYSVDLTMPASGSAVLVQVRDGAADLASNTSIKATGDTHLQTIGSNVASSSFQMGDKNYTTGNMGELVKLANGNYAYMGTKTSGANGEALNAVTLLDPYGKVLSTSAVPDETMNGSLYQGSAAPTPDGGFAVFSSTKFWLFDAAGVRTSPVDGISYTTSATAGGAVSAMGTADGKFVVTYADLSTGVQRFFYKVVDATGADVGSPMALSPVGSVTSLQADDTSRTGGNTSIVRLNDGKIAISYASGTQAGNIVLDANGGTVNPPTSLTLPNTAGPLTTIATQNGGFATAFSVAGGGGWIYRYSSTGAKIGEDTINSYATGTTTENLGLTQLTNGNLLVTLQDNVQNPPSHYVFNYALIFDGSANAPTLLMNLAGRPNAAPFNTNAVMATPDGGFVQITDNSGNISLVGVGQDVAITSYRPNSTGGSANKSSSSAAAPLFGSIGADTLTATGVNQVIEAGAGNDTITVGSALINSLALGGSINGDTGTDTLVLSASNFTLDLSKPALINAINGIEKIDLGTNQSNTVVLNVTEALSMAAGESQKRVFIDGDSTSAVKLSAQYSNGSVTGSWSLDANTSTVNGVTYKVYNYSGDANVKVLVESAITSVVTDYVMSASDIVASSSAGTLTVGDIENAQNASSSDQTTDTTPLIKGSIASLPAGATLSLTRTDVTGGGSPVNLGNLTLDSNNQWSYQETTALQAGKRYKYVAVLTLANSTTVVSNDYSINIVAAGSSSSTEPVPPTPSSQSANPPTLVISDNQSGIAKTGDTIRYYFNFDEVVTGFDAADISASVGSTVVTVSNFTKVSDTLYTADVASAPGGNLLVRVASGSYTDTTGTSGVGATHVQAVSASGDTTWNQVATSASNIAGISGRAITLLNGNVVYLSGNTSQNALTILDANGNLAGTGGMTNTTLNGTIHRADVTALRDGGFAVLSGGQLQTFNADGTTRTAAVSYTTGAATNSGIDAVQLSDGKFMLFYYNASNSFCYKVINANGSDAVTETVMGPAGMADGTETIKGVMDAVVLSDGRVAVAFAGKGLGGYQFFSATGNPVGVTQTYMVEGNTRDMQAVALANGGFAVGSVENRFVWSSPSSYSANALTLFKVDADQTRSERKLLQGQPGWSDEVALAALPEDNLAIAGGIDAGGGGGTSAIYIYDQNLAAKFGPSFNHDVNQVNTMALAGLANGNMVGFANGSDSTTTKYAVFGTELTAKTINDSTSSQILVGGPGDDTIISGGGADRVAGGAGNDTVVVNASNLTQLGTAGATTWVDGGTGTNILKLEGAGLVLDLTNATVGPRVTNFSNYDIGGSGANALTLNVSDVLSSNMTLGTKAHVVKIDGDADDVVTLRNLLDSGTAPGTWSTASTTTISGTTYNVYNYSVDPALQVLIDTQISNVTVS